MAQKISIPELAMAHQREFGANLEWGPIEKTGPDHRPTITVELITNFGTFYATGAPGENKKIVRQLAAQKAWDEYYA